MNLLQKVLLLLLPFILVSSSPLPPIPLFSPLISALQTVVTGGGTAGGAAAGGAGGAATLPAVVGGTGAAATAPAMMMMSSLLPGIGLGLIKGLFIGNHNLK